MKDITRRLRQLRAGRPISQRDLAQKVSMPLSRYWEIENGYREPSTVEVTALARALKCDPTDIAPSFSEAA